jgi:hypothetical protein
MIVFCRYADFHKCLENPSEVYYFTNVDEIYALCVRSATFLIFLIFGGCPLSSILVS